MDASLIRGGLLAAVLVAAVIGSALILLPFLQLLGWSIVIAVAVRPFHKWLLGRGLSPSTAAGLATALAAVLILLPVGFALLQLTRQASAAVLRFSTVGAGGTVDLRPGLGAAGRWLKSHAAVEIDVSRAAQQAATSVLALVAGWSAALLRRSAWAVGGSAGTLFLLFFVLRDGRRTLQAVEEVNPFDPEETGKLIGRVAGILTVGVRGTAVVAAVQGGLGGLAFWALGLPAPLVWGVVMTVFCFVPFLGAPVVWMPAAAILLAQGHFRQAVVLALIGVVLIHPVDNLLRPVLIGTRAQLHPAIALFSVLGGLMAFGPLGLFWGPAVVGGTLTALQIAIGRARRMPTNAADSGRLDGENGSQRARGWPCSCPEQPDSPVV